MFDASFFVALSFALVVGVFIYLRLPAKIGDLLDRRAAAIKSELDEARALREAAQNLLADYRARAKSTEAEMAALNEQAEKDAARITAEAGPAIEARLARRVEQAEEKIARAEAELVRDIRALTADLATTAAARLIRETITPDQRNKFIQQTIDNLDNKLPTNPPR